MTRMAYTMIMGLLSVGCGPTVSIDSDTDADAGSGGTSSSGPTTDPPSSSSGLDSTTTTPGTTTTPPTATDPTIGPASSTTDPTTSEGTGSSDSTDGGESTGGSSSSGDPGGLPDGAQCTVGMECASGHCYVAGALGGICGECSSDADCDFGCNAPNPLASPPEGSTCSAGNLGENCEDDTACVGLECVSVINVPGIIEVSSCSECNTDADCTPGQVCDVDISVADFDGVWTCTSPGTEPIGSSCDPQGSGDEACDSGHCASADIMGLLELGVCSECDVNADCMPGQVCVAPEVSLDGTTTAGFCT